VFKRLLVPLDGSSLAEAVLPLARYLAERLQATLILFHVVEKDAPDVVHGQHHLRQVAEAKAYLDRLAAQLSSGGLNIQQHVHEVQETGVSRTIRDHAEELGADLIVLCAHGQGGIRNALFGGIAEQVIRQGTIPILFVRPDAEYNPNTRPIRRILVPLDGSKAHELTIPVAAALATQCGAQLQLLTVVPTPDTLPVKDAITARVSQRMTTMTLDLSAKQAAEYLQNLTQNLSAQGVKASGTVLRGDTFAKLMETVQAGGIDMVVMATHGRDAVDARWEGSLAPKFFPRSPVPVILMRGTQ
jgi:nucleotide-binding universal stress UspA family protein